MNLDIVICTRDRADSLSETLNALQFLAIPDGLRAKLTVVDNNSTDGTAALLNARSKSARSSPLPLTAVSEPKAGLSHARNAALSHTDGEVILFTDDDVRPPADWISRMVGPIASAQASAVAGGVIFPAHLRSVFTQAWAHRRRGWFACTSAIDRISPDRMVGANMAFHRRVLRSTPVFDPEVGPGPGATGFGDDSLFARQLLAKGHRIAPAFDCAVEHHFDQSRLTPSAFREAAIRMGRSHAWAYYHWFHRSTRLPRTKVLFARVALALTPAHAFHTTLSLESYIEFNREYARQRARPRKYER